MGWKKTQRRRIHVNLEADAYARLQARAARRGFSVTKAIEELTRLLEADGELVVRIRSNSQECAFLDSRVCLLDVQECAFLDSSVCLLAPEVGSHTHRGVDRVSYNSSIGKTRPRNDRESNLYKTPDQTRPDPDPTRSETDRVTPGEMAATQPIDPLTGSTPPDLTVGEEMVGSGRSGLVDELWNDFALKWNDAEVTRARDLAISRGVEVRPCLLRTVRRVPSEVSGFMSRYGFHVDDLEGVLEELTARSPWLLIEAPERFRVETFLDLVIPRKGEFPTYFHGLRAKAYRPHSAPPKPKRAHRNTAEEAETVYAIGMLEDLAIEGDMEALVALKLKLATLDPEIAATLSRSIAWNIDGVEPCDLLEMTP